MRTTVTIDDDVLAAAKALAVSEGRSVGAVLSRLARRGLAPRREYSASAGRFPVFQVSEGAAPLTAERVAAALDEE